MIRSFARILRGLSLIALTGMALPAAANPVTDLPGYWSGWGSVRMNSGSTERVKCVATYKLEGSELQQNLRCASTSYKIDARAELKVSGNRVSGNWTENSYSAKGSVDGRVTDDGLKLSIQGQTFSAALNLNTSKCKQQISIAPQGTEVARISIGLGRC